ncbi:MAG: type II secretion system protein GspD [Chthoniobacterales bacterium]
MTDSVVDSGGVGVREFQGDDVGQVLRLLARQAKINMVVSDQIPPGSSVTMRLENVTAIQAIEIIAQSKGLFLKKLNDVYYVKTAAEQEKEPTESGSYQFSYARVAKPEALTVTASAVGGAGGAGGGAGGAAGGSQGGSLSSSSLAVNTDLLALIKNQLHSGLEPQFDVRTNTVFYRESVSNLDNFRQFLVQIDRPTKQVMIEARLVEVTANPKQAYGINWSGVVGSFDKPKTVSYGTNQGGFNLNSSNNNIIGNFGNLAQGAFAILSVPEMSVTLQALNEDADAEFLANPRIVTADNLPAKIQIVRAQPIASYIPGGAGPNGSLLPPTFSGSEDKLFGNTLLVRPSVNKDSFVTLSVKPEISNKVGDEFFPVGGGQSIKSPVIDTRSLESNVLIKSGDTLAIGGLIQDEVRKSRTKVPVMGDVPVLGYFFQSRSNERVKRNLLVFVTPTVLDPHYGTGLEDQVSGLHHSGDEYADPNGWRNNAKGAVRLVPTANRQVTADYPKPGVPPAPARTGSKDKVRFITEAKDRDF